MDATSGCLRYALNSLASTSILVVVFSETVTENNQKTIALLLPLDRKRSQSKFFSACTDEGEYVHISQQARETSTAYENAVSQANGRKEENANQRCSSGHAPDKDNPGLEHRSARVAQEHDLERQRASDAPRGVAKKQGAHTIYRTEY